MELTEVLNSNASQWQDYFSFARGITVIIISAAGLIPIALGLLQIKGLKPFRGKYPFEEFKNFEEFTKKRPANPEAATSNAIEELPEFIRHQEEKSKDAPVLTWENATEVIPSLSTKQFESLRKNAENSNHPAEQYGESDSDAKELAGVASRSYLTQIPNDDVPEHIKELEQKYKTQPILTWENASEIMPSSSVKESRSLNGNNGSQVKSNGRSNPETQHDTKESEAVPAQR